jgi:large subunit ribosomal protein L11
MGKKQEVSALVEGGKASAGPPLGPQLGPLGVNIGQVIAEINKKTANLAGMQVPVKVIVDTADKSFTVEVGTPPIAALIKKEIGLKTASGLSGTVRAGDLTKEQVAKIAKSKFGSDDEPFLKQVEGTCRSMGITIGQGPLSPEEQKAFEESKKKKPAAPVAAAGEAGKEEEKKEEGGPEEKKPEAEKKEEKPKK